MTTDLCSALSDRMPEVAAGTATWSAAEEGHLAACPACAAEWRLVRIAAELGRGAGERLDPERLAGRVLQGVAARRRAERWKRGAWLTGLAAAAALVLVVWSQRSGTEGATVAVGAGSTAVGVADQAYHLPLAELEGLDTDQLQTVLDGLDAPLTQSAPGVPSFGELDDSQLERVLRSLEG